MVFLHESMELRLIFHGILHPALCDWSGMWSLFLWSQIRVPWIWCDIEESWFSVLGTRTLGGFKHVAAWLRCPRCKESVVKDSPVSKCCCKESWDCELWSSWCWCHQNFGWLPSSKVAVHFPSDLKWLNLEKLLRKPSYSVMGRIDMFALLKSLRPLLRDCLDLKWIQSTQYLRKVGHNFVKYNKNDMIK